VHDPLARVANRGISGNAGLFSTAEDLAVMASVLMNGGKISQPKEGFIATLGSKEPVRIFSQQSVDCFFRIPEGYEEHNFYKPKEDEQLGVLAEKTGHAGGDFYMFRDFLDCIRTGRKPYFDVYVSTMMSAVGILAHRSVLEGGKPYAVPDFRREEDRVLWENDNLSPFYAYGTSEPTIQCGTDPNYKPDEGRRERFLKIMEECKD
jgi:hypothetical protein